jgi:hypothetical protein
MKDCIEAKPISLCFWKVKFCFLQIGYCSQRSQCYCFYIDFVSNLPGFG